MKSYVCTKCKEPLFPSRPYYTIDDGHGYDDGPTLATWYFKCNCHIATSVCEERLAEHKGVEVLMDGVIN